MKSVLTGLGMASLLAVSAGAAHADPAMMMQGYASCNTSYTQCLSSGDYTMASSPAEGMSKMQMNASHAQECASALQACYSSVK